MKSVDVWPVTIRLVHLLLGLGVGFQLVSAWLIGQGAGDWRLWYDWHLIVGQLLVFVLGVRVFLLFRPGVSHWRALVPDRASLMGSKEMLRFYVTLGQTPLPGWFSHNPFWRPVYLLMIVLVGIALLSGLGHSSLWRVAGLSPGQWHAGIAVILGALVLAHLVTVVLHDWKGRTGTISGILGGNRYFPEKADTQATGLKTGSVSVPFDAIKRD